MFLEEILGAECFDTVNLWLFVIFLNSKSKKTKLGLEREGRLPVSNSQYPY